MPYHVAVLLASRLHKNMKTPSFCIGIQAPQPQCLAKHHVVVLRIRFLFLLGNGLVHLLIFLHFTVLTNLFFYKPRGQTRAGSDRLECKVQFAEPSLVNHML